MFEWGTTQNLSKDAYDSIAQNTLQRFREATIWQGSERVGDKTLRRVLQECHDQLHGIPSPMDRERSDALGVHSTVNLTAMKVGIVQSFLSESLLQPDLLPWSIRPTPVPSLSERGRRTALDAVKVKIFEENFSGDLVELARKIKYMVMEQEKKQAEEAARMMETLISDQCAEGGWRTALNAFLLDFANYPFAVLHGPVPVIRPRLVWSGDDLRVKRETFYEFRAISPFDFWYSPDSRNTQDGTSIFIRQRFTRQQLIDMSRAPSYNREAILALLDETEKDDQYNLKWMSENPDQPDDQLVMWTNCSATIDALLAYGRYSGRELQAYGYSGLNDSEYYDATVTVIGGRAVQVYVQRNPHVNIRPVYTASFYKISDRIPGHGIAQRIRDVDRAYQTVFQYMIRNAANVSEPITEADYTRLSKYMVDDDLTSLIPGGFYLADNDIATNNPALRFYSIPSVMPQYGQLLDQLMELAHYVTNIPAALHGTAVGTGVNRTFRGAAMLQGNAVKAITSAVGNIDETVLGPLGTLLFNYNMLYEDIDMVRGDSQIVAQGVQGLLQKELDRGKSMEVIQLVGAAGAQMGEIAPKLFAWAMQNVLKTMDVPEELLEIDLSSFNGQAGGAEAAGPGVPAADPQAIGAA